MKQIRNSIFETNSSSSHSIVIPSSKTLSQLKVYDENIMRLANEIFDEDGNITFDLMNFNGEAFKEIYKSPREKFSWMVNNIINSKHRNSLFDSTSSRTFSTREINNILKQVRDDNNKKIYKYLYTPTMLYDILQILQATGVLQHYYNPLDIHPDYYYSFTNDYDDKFFLIANKFEGDISNADSSELFFHDDYPVDGTLYYEMAKMLLDPYASVQIGDECFKANYNKNYKALYSNERART